MQCCFNRDILTDISQISFGFISNPVRKVKNGFKSIEKPVVVFDVDGNYIARYNSITEGAEKEFVDRTSLMGHLKRKARHKICAGFIWHYEDAIKQQQIS